MLGMHAMVSVRSCHSQLKRCFILAKTSVTLFSSMKIWVKLGNSSSPLTCLHKETFWEHKVVLKASGGKMRFACIWGTGSCGVEPGQLWLEARGQPGSACLWSSWKLCSSDSGSFPLQHGPCLPQPAIPSGPVYFELWIQCFIIREEKDNAAVGKEGTYPVHWQSQIFDSVQNHPEGWKLHRCRNQCLRAACWRLLLMHSLELLKLLSCS